MISLLVAPNTVIIIVKLGIYLGGAESWAMAGLGAYLGNQGKRGFKLYILQGFLTYVARLKCLKCIIRILISKHVRSPEFATIFFSSVLCYVEYIFFISNKYALLFDVSAPSLTFS